MKHIVVFPGSFNPIHVGHLILANHIAAFTPCDEVWLMVSPHNPLKELSRLPDAQLRYHWTQLALENHPKIIASDFELSLSQPSYTLRTLNALQQAHPDDRFSLLIGADNWLIFDQWKDYQQLIMHYSVLIYPRVHFEIKENTLPESVKIVPAPLVELSSTMIRKAIAEGKDMRFFVPSHVWHEIKQQRIYL
jgi:nicotinate-nucleotide adenylyltransferase